MVAKEIISDHIELQKSPDGSNDLGPAQAVDLSANLLRDYVSGSPYATAFNFLRSLSWANDDLTAEFSDGIYDRMLLDGEVLAAILTIKAGVLATEPEIVSAASDETDDEYEQANDIRDFVDRCLTNLAPSLTDTLWNLLDAVVYGSRVAEKVYAFGDGDDAGKLVLHSLKVKPRHATAFVVDVYKNVIGLLAIIPGVAPTISVGSLWMGSGAAPNILPREKFAVLTFRPKDDDPRGTSILRAAYTPWNIKTQILPEWVKFLSIYASPGVIGFVDPASKSTPAKDANGTPTGSTLSPADAMFAALTLLRNSFTAAMPSGAKVQLLEARGEGKAFQDAFDRCDRWIAKAILNQELATGEGEHDSRAAADVHADMLATLIKGLKTAVAQMLRRDLIIPLVRLNYGDALVHLAPDVNLGEVEEGNRAQELASLAALQTAGYFSPSQYAALDAQYNLPPRSPEDLAALAEKTSAQEQLAGAAMPVGGTAPDAGAVPANVTPIETRQPTKATGGAP